jgi:hypothetical protein
VILPDGVQNVGEEIFYGSADSRDMVTANILSEVEIEGKAYKVRSIDVDAFKDCEGTLRTILSYASNEFS